MMITWKWMMISKLSIKIEAEQLHSGCVGINSDFSA